MKENCYVNENRIPGHCHVGNELSVHLHTQAIKTGIFISFVGNMISGAKCFLEYHDLHLGFTCQLSTCVLIILIFN